MCKTSMKTLLCLAICFYGSDSALTGYDCSSTTILEYDVLMSDLLPSCQTIRESDKYMVHIVELPEQKVVGYNCKITFTDTLTDVNGFRRVVANGSEIITREECLETHRTLSLNLAGGRVFVHTNGTVNHEESVGDHYEFVPGTPRNKTRKYRYTKTYQITLSEKEGIVDLQENIVRFDDNVMCDYNNYSCHEDHIGLLAWDPIVTDKKYSLIYSGFINFAIFGESYVSGRQFRYAVITSELAQKVFLLLTYDKLTINGDTAFRTELPNVYVTLSKYSLTFRQGWEYDGRLKNVYSVPYHPQQLIDVVDVGKRRCLSDNQVLYNRLKSLPTFSRILLDQEGTMAIKINKRTGSFSVEKCEKTEATVRGLDSKCHQEIPVRVGKNRELFLNSITRALTEHSTPISCEENRYNTTNNIVWFEHPSEHVEANVEIFPTETLIEVTTNGVLTATVENAKVKSKGLNVQKSYLDSACPDWVKVIGLVSLFLWIFVVIARLFKLVVFCVPKTYHREESDTDTAAAGLKVDAVRFKRRYIQTWLKRKQPKPFVVSDKQPEPVVSYVV